MEIYSHLSNVFEVFQQIDDIAFGTFVVACAVGVFLAGYWIISKIVSSICNND